MAVGVPALMVLPGLGSLLGGLGPADRSASYLLALVIFGGFHAVNLAFGQPVGSTVQQVVIAFLIGSVFYEDRQALHDAVHLTLDRGQVLRWVS